ncbi:hypothetical protein CBF34_08705 [Vagococcus penaei]|uniref:Uncharacterized protein n=1 Tax=Vagococcus penaei TaxID=633807 RepID=A0A1Q2D719_9ENTE|nr:phosphonate C-P lyase system protein PhnG [Vagococcus penaei]AQP54198.1 hypothetical protein BW732_08170 [Vagococcus penaei]RST99982.1 hypothetical protein CBF34_08705 [Vagococcus penaei]
MNKKERTWVLVEDQTLASELVEQYGNQYERHLVEIPRTALVMMTTRETAKNSLFYSGEVLVSYAKVRIGSSYGTGMILGEQLKKAEYLAIIDALYPLLSDIEKVQWIKVFEQRRAALLHTINQEQEAINQTKVSFDVMEVEED